jgi:hypothetical protein
VVAKGGRPRRLHVFRFPAVKRAHFAVVLTLLLLAAPSYAQSDIDFDPAITQEQFGQFSRIVAQGIFASPVHPAGAAGLLRFDVGIGATVVKVDTGAEYWQRAVGDDFTYGGDYVGIPRLIVVKGLGAATIAGSYAKISDTGISVLGASVDIPIIRGGIATPTVALRASYATLRGVDVYELDTYGVEGFIGKGFGPLTLYGGYGRMRSNAEGQLTEQIVIEDSSDLNRYTVGVRFSLGFPKLVVEATQAEERAYSAKVSFGL